MGKVVAVIGPAMYSFCNLEHSIHATNVLSISPFINPFLMLVSVAIVASVEGFLSSH